MVVLVVVLALSLPAHAADTQIAIYKSPDCASVERALLVVPGTNILDGNCISRTELAASSLQVTSLGCDCYGTQNINPRQLLVLMASVIAHFQEGCADETAIAEYRECIHLDIYGVHIQSFSIHSTPGGNCVLPDRAVLKSSARVPPALSTKLASIVHPIISMPTATTSCSDVASLVPTPTTSINAPPHTTSNKISSPIPTGPPSPTSAPGGSPTPDKKTWGLIIGIAAVVSCIIFGIGFLCSKYSPRTTCVKFRRRSSRISREPGPSTSLLDDTERMDGSEDEVVRQAGGNRNQRAASRRRAHTCDQIEQASELADSHEHDNSRLASPHASHDDAVVEHHFRGNDSHDQSTQQQGHQYYRGPVNIFYGGSWHHSSGQDEP